MKVSRGASLDRFYILRAFGFGIFLHRIHHSDPPGVYHSHPWNGVSLIAGRYVEQFRDEYPRAHRRWFINFVRAERFHRTIVDRPVWTLFIHGRKCNQWTVFAGDKQSAPVPWDGASASRRNYLDAIN